MLGIGSTELLVILVVALIVLGPKNLPKIAQTLGKAMGEFRRYSTEFQRTLNTEIAFDEHKKEQAKADEEMAAAAAKSATQTAGSGSAPSAEAATAAPSQTGTIPDAESGATLDASTPTTCVQGTLEIPNPADSARKQDSVVAEPGLSAADLPEGKE